MITAYGGANHNPRLISPSLVLLAVALGLVAATIEWTVSWWTTMMVCTVFCLQLVVTVSGLLRDPDYRLRDVAATSRPISWATPATLMKRADQWDWFQLQRLLDAKQLAAPSIVYLGSAAGLSTPGIHYAWVHSNRKVRVTKLWRHELGEIDWVRAMETVSDSDVVLTVPGLVGEHEKQALDNQHNDRLIERLRRHPRFSQPVMIEMGRLDPVPLFVFIRKPQHQ